MLVETTAAVRCECLRLRAPPSAGLCIAPSNFGAIQFSQRSTWNFFFTPNDIPPPSHFFDHRTNRHNGPYQEVCAILRRVRNRSTVGPQRSAMLAAFAMAAATNTPARLSPARCQSGHARM
jgi:hypothetical protein